MAQRLGFPCYLEGMDAWTIDEGFRIVTSLDSLPKRPRCYDIVILDEAGMLRHHTLSTTIQGRLLAVITSLEDVLINAKTVFLTQHNLSHSDIEYFMDLAGQDSRDRSKLHMGVVHHLTQAVDVRVTTVFPVLVTKLAELYNNSFGNSGVCEKPILVCCTTIRLVEDITKFLKSLAPDETAKGRIRPLHSRISHAEWNRKWLSDPNTPDHHNVDVLVMTQCAPVGLSVESHFTQLVCVSVILLNIFTTSTHLKLLYL
jgi:hypothetical protein